MDQFIKIVDVLWPIVATILGLVGTFFMLLGATRFVSKRDHEKLSTRVNGIETAIARMPDGRKLSSLAESIARLSGDVNTLDVKIKSTNDLLARVEKPLDLLLKNQLKD